MFKKLPIAALFTSMLAGPALAADADAGKTIVMQGNGKGALACMTCHGPDGAGNALANFPRLAGLDGAYIAKQIADYKNGGRNNPIMKPVAAMLTEQEAADVGAYYASQKFAVTAQPGSAEQMTLGEKLAIRGDWSKNVPACFSCHGPNGAGVGTAFPAIAGQHANYVSTQINEWKSGARSNDPVGLMKVVAERLTDAETAAVSAYLASLAAK